MMLTENEFDELKVIAPFVKIPDCVYAPNCIAWVGAALQMSLGQESDRFLTTLEQYQNDEEVINDRFGEAFLTFERKGNYFNRNFEVNYKQ